MNNEPFVLVVEGLSELNDISKIPSAIIRAARIAVNDTATRGRTRFAHEVMSQVNLPANYVAPRSKRLYVSKTASDSTLEATITARSRPTSLARFAVSNPIKKQRQVRVAVKPGAIRTLPNQKSLVEGYSAFLIRLRAGSTAVDTKNNLGLALRVPPGKRPDKAYKPKTIGKNLYLLYGPSVAQIIHGATSGQGVATDLAPELVEMLSTEFYRQMDLR